MKALRNYIDKIKPNFEEGGKFQAFRSEYNIEDWYAHPRRYRQQTYHVYRGYCAYTGIAVRYV